MSLLLASRRPTNVLFSIISVMANEQEMKFSIITTTYNAAANLQHCFASISEQEMPVEHIVVDGASTDETVEIIEKHRSLITRYVSEPDQGIYDALNKGIKMATGDVIGILHADDFYADNNVLMRVSKIFEHEDVDACYGDLVYVKKQAEICKPETVRDKPNKIYKIHRYWKSSQFYPRKFYWGWMPPHPTFFVRRSVYDKYGAFRLDLGTAADYELMLRFLLKHRIKSAYIPEVLICMRTGGTSNVTLRNRLKANLMDRKAWKVNGLEPYLWTIPFKPLSKIPQWFRSPV